MLRKLFMGAVLALWAVAAGVAAAAPPNIVVMLTDDQRWDSLGFVQRSQPDGRFPFLKDATPNIDRIAAGGVWFNNAFTVDSLCSPSRAAFLTGQYNHTNGITNNVMPLPVTTRTYATLLRAAGYRTGYFGKWHMGEQVERPGFDVHASYVGQGVYVDCPFLVNGVLTPTTGWVDDITADHAVRFIRESGETVQPFLAVVGFKTSHGPYDATSKPAWTNTLFRTVVEDTPPNAYSFPPYIANPLPSDVVGEMYRNYFRQITAMDQAVGRVLAALDEAGVADDTIVVFASDNGYHLREHGSYNSIVRDGEKRTAYEASLRIPLLLRYPRLIAGGRTIPAQVLNIDLAPTLINLAGLPAAAGMQGKSWVPLLRGTATSLRTGFFYEYFRNVNTPLVPRIVAFRRSQWKLITYPDYPEYGRELYNIRLDPWERTNRIADPTAKTPLDSLSAALATATAQLNYRIPPGADPQR
jgi:arylsulfatase A-like enzyme